MYLGASVGESTSESARSGWFAQEGTPFPLGATWVPQAQAYNFALYSKHASKVTLLLFDDLDLMHPVVRYELNYATNKSGRIWHCRVAAEAARQSRYYAYQVTGPAMAGPFERHAFDPDKLLLDPYAEAVFFPETFDRQAAIGPGSNLGRAPLAVLPSQHPTIAGRHDSVHFHEHDLVIYELHVRGFTKHPSSQVDAERRGTYLGVIDKIPHLIDLGVTAVELLPVHQFDPQEGNYWGYMTLNFFAPHAQFAVDPRHAAEEFFLMVQALHAAGIEVLMDVVFNHTVESDQTGPCYSFKGIDNSTYYMTNGSDEKPYANFSGTGNTLHTKNRFVGRMILDSLRHWVQTMHIDGFRFDLAGVFSRHEDGSTQDSDTTLIAAIRADPALGSCRLIAEPWDAAGLNQLGRDFPGKRWYQWNGNFRDDIRRFVKGDPGLVGALMQRLYGSDDLFPDNLMEACHPYQSVNYINSHDGFTLYDTTAYNERHNWANGEHNRDGNYANHSWNCGWEGDHDVPQQVLRLRIQQAKNFCTLLFLANGTPMFCAGDEFLRTQLGNNNPYNQDNETTWIDWDRLQTFSDFYRFFKNMVAFRKSHPSIARSRFWRDDVRWFGIGPHVDLSDESRTLAYFLSGASQHDNDLYVMINASWEPHTFEIQVVDERGWKVIVDTSHEPPHDFYDPGHEPHRSGKHYFVMPRSIVVLLREQLVPPSLLPLPFHR